MNEFTDEQKLAFLKVYVENYASMRIQEGVDLHQEFADELSIGRSEAKQLFYRMNYSFDNITWGMCR